MRRYPKISDHRTLLKILKDNGFKPNGNGGKHEKWEHNDGRSVSVPRHHTQGKFSRMCAQNILKTAKIAD